jgi:hypothetical protein
MAKFLRELKVDLNDERAVMRTLQRLHFDQGDIVKYSDKAVDLARVEAPAPFRTSIDGDGFVAIFAAAVWLAWYCLACSVT